MTYSCIKRQFMKIYKAGYSRCINEKDVKVNIMRFRTLRSIEFQSLCSRNWNFSRSENYIFRNLRSTSFLPMTYSCIKSQFIKIYKACYSRCTNEKDVKVNIMPFRTLRSIVFQVLCSRNWNFTRSENYIFGIYGP
jgi:lysine/ornithine N-monooxygenase